MPNHCSECGAPRSGDPFCPQCGRAHPSERPHQPVYMPPTQQSDDRTDDGRPEAPPTGPPSVHPPAGPQEWTAPASVRAPQAPVRPPLGDPLRDLTAFLLLLGALFLPWDFHGSTADHWWALMPVLLAIVGISVSHVARVFPVTPVVVQLAKLVTVGPLLLAAAVTVVAEAAQLVADGTGLLGLGGAGGIGAGVALALAGAMLVVQPRGVDDLHGRTWDLLWWGLAVAAAAGAALLTVVTWVWFLVDEMGLDFLVDNPSWLPSIAGSLLLQLLVVGVPLTLLALRRASGRRLLAAVGFTWMALLVLAELLASDDGSDRIVDVPVVESWSFPGAAAFLLGTAGALAVARGTARRTDRAGDDLGGRAGTVAVGLLLAGALLLLDAALTAWTVVRDTHHPASAVTVVLLTFLGAGLMVAGGLSAGLTGLPAAPVALAGAGVLLGVVVLAFREASDVFGRTGVDAVFVLGWFVLPAVAAVSVPRAGPGRWVADGPAPVDAPPAQ